MTEPAVYRIAIPNPHFEGANNAWVIGGDSLTLIDTAVGTDDALAALEAGFAEHGLSMDRVGQVVLTHKHFDHVGLAWVFAERCGARVLIHEEDRDAVLELRQRLAMADPIIEKRLREWGVPTPELRELESFRNAPRQWRPKSVDAQPLRDGQTIDAGGGSLEVIHTPGHTVGSICLRLGRYLFSGDHVLPDMSPNIGAGDMHRGGLLRRYFDSLRRIREHQADDLLVMPGHGAPFTRLDERCAGLIAHHERRLELIQKHLHRRRSMTVYQIARALFKKMKGIHLLLGTAEAHSHLEYLKEEGRVTHRDGTWSAV